MAPIPNSHQSLRKNSKTLSFGCKSTLIEIVNLRLHMFSAFQMYLSYSLRNKYTQWFYVKSRKKWKRGSFMEVYSNSRGQWFLAECQDVFEDSEGEWVPSGKKNSICFDVRIELQVMFCDPVNNQTIMKQIQRFSTELRPCEIDRTPPMHAHSDAPQLTRISEIPTVASSIFFRNFMYLNAFKSFLCCKCKL